jgi:SNF2 family DNA or RNA helicase
VVVYRLLTAGSVEIEMMEKQISKKKLERLTIHGGDFRRAGEMRDIDAV